MALLFKKTKELESQLDHYLDIVVRGAMVFKQGIKFYLEGCEEEFEKRLQDLRKMESKADGLRRDIESKLYIQTLIPESRGDVLGLLESTDKVLDITAETLQQFSVEIPDILEEIHQLYLELAQSSVSAVECMVMAIRAYFRDPNAVRDYINKVSFYEKESDRTAEKIKRIVFRKDIHLSRKIHMRYFTLHVELIADKAEDVCDRLAIAAIKRSE